MPSHFNATLAVTAGQPGSGPGVLEVPAEQGHTVKSQVVVPNDRGGKERVIKTPKHHT